MSWKHGNGYDHTGRRVYNKGGASDPSGYQREQDAARQKQMAKSMKDISHTFDGGPAGKRGVNAVDPTALQPGGTYFDADGNQIVLPPVDAGGRSLAARAKAIATRPELFSGTEDVPATKGFGDDYYRSIADQFLAFQKPLYDEQVATARRELPLQFASTGSSDFIRRQGELERDIARGESDLKDQALDFANQRRSEVERDRSDLLSMANSGIDASAIANMSAGRAAALAKQPVFSPIADLFQKYTAGYANSQIANGNNQAATRRDAPLLFNNRGSSAVRTVA